MKDTTVFLDQVIVEQNKKANLFQSFIQEVEKSMIPNISYKTLIISIPSVFVERNDKFSAINEAMQNEQVTYRKRNKKRDIN